VLSNSQSVSILELISIPKVKTLIVICCLQEFNWSLLKTVHKDVILSNKAFEYDRYNLGGVMLLFFGLLSNMDFFAGRKDTLIMTFLTLFTIM
jgi:hypothetical protein